MDYQYLIDVNDRKNWLYPITSTEADGTVWEEARTIHFPMGADSLLRVTDSVFHPQPSTHIHYHRSAHEIFFWSMAPFDFYQDGKVAEVEPGCITLVRPYEPHGFGFKDLTRKVGFFHRMDMTLEDGMASGLLREKHPGARQDPEFPSGSALPDFVRSEAPVAYERTVWQEMPGVRHISRPMYTEAFPGLSMKMIVAKWETAGVKEVWAAALQKGFWAESSRYPVKTEMFYVTEGKVKFRIYDDEFVAHKECIVKIPRYAAYRMEALTDTVLYDVNGLTNWFNFFMEHNSILAADPGRYQDPAAVKALKAKHLCDISAIGIA